MNPAKIRSRVTVASQRRLPHILFATLLLALTLIQGQGLAAPSAEESPSTERAAPAEAVAPAAPAAPGKAPGRAMGAKLAVP